MPMGRGTTMVEDPLASFRYRSAAAVASLASSRKTGNLISAHGRHRGFNPHRSAGAFPRILAYHVSEELRQGRPMGSFYHV